MEGKDENRNRRRSVVDRRLFCECIDLQPNWRKGLAPLVALTDIMHWLPKTKDVVSSSY